MKKRITAIILSAITAFSFTACQSPGGNRTNTLAGTASKAETSEKPVTIKVGDNWSSTHPMAAALDNVFKPLVEEKSNGSIKIELYHSGTLGNEGDLWDGVRNGTIEIAIVGTPMNQEYTTMLISDWPFLYRDLDHAKKVWTGSIAEDISGEFHEKFPTVYMLGWGPNSARTFTSNKQLTSVDDFKGQKFRMPSNPIHMGIVENLGASAQVIPLGELFSALETGVVDGQDNGMVTVISEAFYEVQKYVYETNHIISTLEIVASASFMDGLSDNQQQIIRDAAKASCDTAWDEYIKSVDTDRQFLKDHGVTVTECTPEDKEKIIEQIKPLTDKLYSENPWAKDLTEKIKAVQ
ncbi:C4-dicarboxylate ABC transporter substrate-binding protein [Lacrimispora amygdalina]|uniref:C4-dicarboxylate ABC transporter substrate-binding protein n=1 Tax=Lacrimispora amygdalina TaxID=253257 RepID=A0A3E2NFZ0_9FIRM|nr:TRAP transporter substrate-binding protein [Clostridium indicum]RFZ79938.1 C4-dicarboxylate ABC transporter substrate-binding protein [Clostridium indicum]